MWWARTPPHPIPSQGLAFYNTPSFNELTRKNKKTCGGHAEPLFSDIQYVGQPAGGVNTAATRNQYKQDETVKLQPAQISIRARRKKKKEKREKKKEISKHGRKHFILPSRNKVSKQDNTCCRPNNKTPPVSFPQLISSALSLAESLA